MREGDGPYQQWEKRPPFTTKDGRWVYPLYAPARASQPNHIWAFTEDVDPTSPDLEYSLRRDYRIASLDWVGRTISIPLTDPAWEKQGVATHMFWLADAETMGDLNHAPCADRVSLAGEAFVRATRPEQACNGKCEPVCRDWEAQVNPPEDTSVRPPSVWAKIAEFFRR